MKTIRNLFTTTLLLLCGFMANAQSDNFDRDIEKFLQINGSEATYDMMYEQIKQQFKMSKPAVPDSVWAQLKTAVYDKELKTLTKQLVPIYKKHFTHADVKELIAFYESPVGKKLAKETPLITKDAMQISQTWAVGLMGKFNTWLTQKGY